MLRRFKNALFKEAVHMYTLNSYFLKTISSIDIELTHHFFITFCRFYGITLRFFSVCCCCCLQKGFCFQFMFKVISVTQQSCCKLEYKSKQKRRKYLKSSNLVLGVYKQPKKFATKRIRSSTPFARQQNHFHIVNQKDQLIFVLIAISDYLNYYDCV